MPNNPYNDVIFADQFFRVQGDSTIKTHGPGLKAFIESVGIGKEEWIMDLGCGMGPLMDFLYQEGYHVAGLDSSTHMIFKARERFQEGYDLARLELMQMDILNWEEDERYALVYSVGEVLCFLFEKEDFRKGLSRIYSALKPGGYLIFDYVSLSDKTESYSYHSSTRNQNNTDIISMIVNPDLGIQQTHRTMYHREPETGKFICANEVFTMRMYRSEDINDRLAAAGFEGIYFADRDHLTKPLPPEEIKGFKFCVCQKPGE